MAPEANGHVSPSFAFQARPKAFRFQPDKTALIVIDMQRDFVEPGGFGAEQAGVAGLAGVQSIIPAVRKLLEAARAANLTIIHTREGHLPDLSDLPTPKNARRWPDAEDGRSRSLAIGDVGPTGHRLLVRGEAMHDIVDDLRPLPDEIVLDKPGKGAFYGTDLHLTLATRGISHLIICGVTTECCVHTTTREANDRGFEPVVVAECVAGYAAGADSPAASALELICFADGLFGYVAKLQAITTALAEVAALSPAEPPQWDGDLAIGSLTRAYRANIVTPQQVVHEVYARIEAYPDKAVWLHLLPESEVLAAADALVARYPDRAARPPLFGVPFSIKDSFDYAGVPTTAACPAYAYIPPTHARAVELLLAAGALPIGKVNLDQLATGLVGMRSPYGAPASVFSTEYVSGGSSSGSAVSVASKQVSFSLATDTAGSGRVPAAFNNIVGFKPTRGTISAVGLVPCCPQLDSVAIEALNIADASRIYQVLRAFDERDPFAKVSTPTWAIAPRAILQPKETFTFAAPPRASESWAYLCPEYEALFRAALERLQKASVGGKLVHDVDYKVFEDAGRLLYEGSFVAERVSSIQTWYDAHPAPANGEPDVLLPEIRNIYANAASVYTARNAWQDLTSMSIQQKKAQAQFRKFQALVVPTVPLHPTKAAYLAEPIALNHKLGKFMHYANILDMCGVAIPAGFTPDGMPFSITVLGLAHTEGIILEVAERFLRDQGLPTGLVKRA